MKISPWILTLALGLRVDSVQAAGGVSGGGGNAVVCFGRHTEIPRNIRDPHHPHFGELLDEYIPKITSIETYDLQQARAPQGWDSKPRTVLDIFQDESAEHYLERLADTYDWTVPAVGDLIRAANHIFPERNIVPQSEGLPKINDAAETGRIDSVHCVLATMAMNYFSGTPGTASVAYYLNTDERLLKNPLQSPLSRAVLRLHEGLYVLARAFAQAEDSRDTRDLVRLLITIDPTLSAAELLRSIDALGFRPVIDQITDARFGRHVPEALKSYPWRMEWAILTSLQADAKSSDHEWFKRHPSTAYPGWGVRGPEIVAQLRDSYQREWAPMVGWPMTQVWPSGILHELDEAREAFLLRLREDPLTDPLQFFPVEVDLSGVPAANR